MKKIVLLVLVLAVSCMAADSRQTAPIDESCESPQVISAVSATYPAIAFQARVVGTVRVKIEVNEGGEVVVATPSEGPWMMHEASKNAANHWRFQGTGRKENGTLVFKYILLDVDKNPPDDTADVFYPPCKVEIRRRFIKPLPNDGAPAKKRKTD